MPVSEIELEYQRRNDAMSPAERLARSAAMLAWTRQQIALQIKREYADDLSPEELKLLVALRLYQDEPEVVKLIKQGLQLVSR